MLAFLKPGKSRLKIYLSYNYFFLWLKLLIYDILKYKLENMTVEPPIRECSEYDNSSPILILNLEVILVVSVK